MRLLLLLCSLLLALPAEAAMKAGSNMAGPGHHRLKAAVAAVPPPIDGLASTPYAACSFRKLRAAYAGFAMKLRRASDTLTSDIGFVGNDFDSTAANNWCLATTCGVETCYDQSGNSRNYQQVTPANQPLFVAICTNGRPCFETTAAAIAITGPSITPATGVATLAAVGARTAGTANCVFIRENAATGQRLMAGNATPGSWQLAGNGSAFATGAAEGVWHAAIGVINGAASVLNIDGTETVVGVTGNITAGTSQAGGAASTTCRESEFMLWDNVIVPPADRAGVIANQRAYFGTP